ncbi:MAG: hypothetical protein ACHQE6_07450 [Solirubrobacterales bacterium]
MRASLLHPISERRQARRSRGAHRPSPAPEPDATAQAPAIAAQGPNVAAEGPDIAAHGPDIAAQRVREAGGPTDRASYACQCGYLFTAAVSTTVGCPHCGTAQAW